MDKANHIFYARTFGTRRVLDLDEARKCHGMIEEVVVAVEQSSATLAKHLGDLWGALVDAPLAQGESCSQLRTNVDLTMPVAHAAELRRSDAVPAAFAFGCLAAALMGVDAGRKPVDLRDALALRAALQRGWDAFEARRIAANKVREGFGCDLSASWHTLRDLQEMPDGKSFEAKMLKIAELAGRIIQALGGLRSKQPSDDPQHVVGATTGKHVERLMPGEMARLFSDDETEADAQRLRVLRGQAQVKRMRGTRDKTRGPLVLVIDESGSMHEEDTGARGRNTWAKAAAVALTRIAWSEGRVVRAVHFGTATVCQRLPQHDRRALFEMARSFLGGGTDFVRGLRAGYEQVGDLKREGHDGADVVYITDGEEGGTNQRQRMDATISAGAKQGIKLWDVAIGQEHSADFPPRKRAEKYVFVHDRSLAQLDAGAKLGAKLGDAARADKRSN